MFHLLMIDGWKEFVCPVVGVSVCCCVDVKCSLWPVAPGEGQVELQEPAATYHLYHWRCDV